MAGWCLEKTNAPAKLEEFEFVDPVTDQTVYLSTSKTFSILCVGSRRFYFNRLTGKFDGTSAPSRSVADRVDLGKEVSDAANRGIVIVFE